MAELTTEGKTPSELSETVLTFCEKVSPGQTPVYLDCEPTSGADNHCFPIVERQIDQHGGTLVFGWAIWIRPKVLIEAEFHGVWRDQYGVLHDIAPRTDGTERILFVPDPINKYEGRQLNNIRHALSEAPDVHDLIRTYNDRYRLLYANQTGQFAVPLPESLISGIQERIHRAEAAVMMRLMNNAKKVIAPKKKRKR